MTEFRKSRPYWREVDRWTEWGNDPYEAVAAYLNGMAGITVYISPATVREAIKQLDLRLVEKL